MHLVDEVLQHLLADTEVGDNAVFHRTNGLDVARRASQHAFGISTNGNNTFLIAGGSANGNHRRFVQHNATIADVNEGVGSAQVDGQITGKHATNFFEHALTRPRGRVG